MLLGNLGADPELRFTQSGQAVLNMRIATTESYLDKDKVRRERTDWQRPVCSGAETFIAGTASCRIKVAGVDALHATISEKSDLEDTWWGTREFAVLDPTRNLIWLVERSS